MKKLTDEKIYNPETALEICELVCNCGDGDLSWHETMLYRSKKGAFFISGWGGPTSRWARAESQGCYSGGEGLELISQSEAQRYAEEMGLSPDEMIAAGFEIEEG